VSVIVVCWNAADVIGRCLDQLFAQDYANREIIVVDDGSDDDTAQIAEQARERGELTLVRSPRNRGCPAARNVGLEVASGEIVAFVDADGFAAVDWLSEVVLAFAGDPRIGGVASTVFYDDNPLVVNGAGGTTNRQGWAADLSMNESYECVSIAAEALYPMGCGMALRRDALERVGQFDDRMLNYYDDVDYGTRLWRAGYRVAVSAYAWIDHGGTAGDSARKRLWCERHRMRVVLKHAPAAKLRHWSAMEVRSLLEAPASVRIQKLRSIAWNLRHLPSALASRRRLRFAERIPDRLIVASWGDGFPAGMPLRLSPAPSGAGPSIDADDAHSERQLLHGWFPPERVGERRYRWAGLCAGALVHLREPVRRVHLEYAHAPIDVGPITLSIRHVGGSEPLTPVWTTRLPWQYISRSVENHPIELAPGDYEVVFSAAHGWSDPPRETRSLAFALSSIRFAASFEIEAGGAQMASPAVEEQLVSGWFEPESSDGRTYRWAATHAAVVIRIAERASSIEIRSRFPPRGGGLSVAIHPLDRMEQLWNTRLTSTRSDWREDRLELDLPAGDYLVSFDCDAAWSNAEGGDPAYPPENRPLGFALASLSFAA
jgi:hypothetical protein